MPYSAATKDGAKKIAAQEEIFLICSFCAALASFCRLAVSVPSRVRAFCSSCRNESARAVTLSTWSSHIAQVALQLNVHPVLLEATLEPVPSFR